MCVCVCVRVCVRVCVARHRANPAAHAAQLPPPPHPTANAPGANELKLSKLPLCTPLPHARSPRTRAELVWGGEALGPPAGAPKVGAQPAAPAALGRCDCHA